MKRISYIIVIILSLIFAVSDYFIVMRQSYDKYLEGEYFFRYQAQTVNDHTDDWYLSEAAMSLDASDQKTLLMHFAKTTVYAWAPAGNNCTVLSGSYTIEDFPLGNLKFEDADKDYFYGKKYTYDEYIEILNGMTEEQLEGPRVSDSKMRSYLSVKRFMFILIGVDVALAIVLFFLYRAELDGSVDLVLLLGALYGFFFEVITAFVF